CDEAAQRDCHVVDVEPVASSGLAPQCDTGSKDDAPDASPQCDTGSKDDAPDAYDGPEPVIVTMMNPYHLLLLTVKEGQLKLTFIIDYGGVRVKFAEFANSMRRDAQSSVSKYVINAHCRKLFKDCHPSNCYKHYFFSTVGDYLMRSYPVAKHEQYYESAKRSFKLAHVLDLRRASLLFFLYSMKDIVNFFRAQHDGIFLMKYLELWDPCDNMLVKFTSRNILDIRLLYVVDMLELKREQGMVQAQQEQQQRGKQEKQRAQQQQHLKGFQYASKYFGY
ncbi:hypothetical protein EJB05_12670, partial [Eragrostis curvula]